MLARYFHCKNLSHNFCYHVKANDADAEPFNNILYRLEPPEGVEDDFNVIQQNFRIDAQSGAVFTRAQLDHEQRSAYVIKVVASNSVDSFMSGTATLTVTISDVNDNPPYFLFPSATNHSIAIRGDVEINDIIAQVRAFDDDSSSNAQLHYKMTFEDGVTSPDVDSLFTINGVNGDVIVIGDLGDYVGMELNVSVEVEDGGEPRLRETATLTIAINGVASGSGVLPVDGSDVMEGVRLQNIGIVIGVACGSVVIIALLAIAKIGRAHV